MNPSRASSKFESFFLYRLSFCFILTSRLVVGQSKVCKFACCSGNFFTPISVGTVPAARPCVLSRNRTKRPLAVLRLGGTAPNWNGNWKPNGQCSRSQCQCCCLVGVCTVAQSGANALSSGPVAGQCGGLTSTTITVTPYPTTNSFSATLQGGDSSTFTLSGDSNTITQVDNTDSACSGGAIRNAAMRGLNVLSLPVLAFLGVLVALTSSQLL